MGLLFKLRLLKKALDIVEAHQRWKMAISIRATAKNMGFVVKENTKMDMLDTWDNHQAIDT